MNVSWFPATVAGAVVASPRPGTQLSAASRIRLTFSAPVSTVLGTSLPTFDPAVSGTWREADTHTLVFTPSGAGMPLATQVHVSSCRGRWRSRARSAVPSCPPTGSAG